MENLRNLMRQQKITQETLAKQLGLSQASIYKYLEDKAEPNISSLKKMADFFGVTIDFLVGHPTKSSLPLNLYSEKQQELLAAIKNLNDEECLKILGYIDGLQGKDFKAVDWEN